MKELQFYNDKAIEDSKKPITKTRHGKNSDLLRWCPGCLERLYRKTPTCPNCGQKIKWDKGIK